MLCNRCKKNPAVYHERIIHNGISADIYLCQECKKTGSFENQALGMFKSFLSAFGDIAEKRTDTNENKKPVLKCPECGCTSGDYLDTGFVGCSHCYETFAPMIEIAVKRLQKDDKHIGKTPVKMTDEEVEITKLLKEREDAVKTEDFMLAQDLTDRINELKGGPKQ